MLFESSVAWVYMPGVRFYIHVDTFFFLNASLAPVRLMHVLHPLVLSFYFLFLNTQLHAENI